MDTKALALDQRDRHREAVKRYDKVLPKTPVYIVPLNNKGIAQANIGHYQQAITWYDEGLEKVPGELYMLTNKAKILGMNFDNYTDALKLIDQNSKKKLEHKGLLCNKVNFGKEGIQRYC
jgi:tetratricopeptide (TPR) repeat protein